jgi:hypothetical protein
MKKLAATLEKSEKQWALVSFREAEGLASDLFLHVLFSNVAEESAVLVVKIVFSVYLRGPPSETMDSCPL